MNYMALTCVLAAVLTLADHAFIGRTRSTASAFDPASVSGLVMWYKASVISDATGTEVTTWDDSSPSGFDLVGTAGAAPYVTNSSEINGQKWLSFDGSNDILKHGLGALAQPTTVFALCKFDGLPAASATVLDGTNASTRMLMGITSAGAFQISGGTALTSAGSLVDTGNWVLFEATFKASPSAAIITNGVSQLTGDAGSQAASGLFVGQRQATARYLDGGLAEILIYTNDVSSDDRTAIREYFTTKFGAYSTW